jgi:hypothetical protein
MSDSPQVRDLVQAILEITAPITQMLDHMARSPTQPETDEIVATMKRLLEDVLAPLAGHADVDATTALLVQAEDLIFENIHFVPHHAMAKTRTAPRRRGRNRC